MNPGKCNVVNLVSGAGAIRLSAPPFILEQLMACGDLHYRIPDLRFCSESELRPEAHVSSLAILAGPDEIKIHHPTTSNVEIVYSDSRLSGTTIADTHLIRDLVWIILPILEFSRQQCSEFLIHASSVDVNGSGIVFIGPTHSGKTLMSSLLAFRHSCKIIGTEHTILGKSGIHGGTQIMEFNRSLKTLLPELPVEEPPSTNLWHKSQRDSLDLKTLALSSSRSPLSKVVYIAVANESSLTSVEWGRRKSLVILCDYARWMINASQSFLFGASLQLPPLDTLELSAMRLGMINEWLDSGLRIIYMKGKADEIASALLNF